MVERLAVAAIQVRFPGGFKMSGQHKAGTVRTTAFTVVHWLFIGALVVTAVCFTVCGVASFAVTGLNYLAPGFGPWLAAGFVGIAVTCALAFVRGLLRDD